MIKISGLQHLDDRAWRPVRAFDQVERVVAIGIERLTKGVQARYPVFLESLQETPLRRL